jgi:hypothetical protein
MSILKAVLINDKYNPKHGNLQQVLPDIYDGFFGGCSWCDEIFPNVHQRHAEVDERPDDQFYPIWSIKKPSVGMRINSRP